MPTRNISLTAEQDAFVEKVVEAGEYRTQVKLFATLCAYSNSVGEKTASD